jgi:hypothetical protein
VRREKQPTWNDVLRRFANFQARPCLRAAGPDHNRPKSDVIFRRLQNQYDDTKLLLPERPRDLTQRQLARLLQRKGLTTHGLGKRPEHRAFWHGLWRALILDRDDYRCCFCRRSGETGVNIHREGCLALRLELDHVEPRSSGGHDYLLTNIRTICRTCNIARSRMTDKHFRAELVSLAAAVIARSARRN